ncbi:MAG: ribonuclease/clavin/mitogillin [Planctomycetota bacterium]|jgi:ribonuclease/clavin/mitogillin
MSSLRKSTAVLLTRGDYDDLEVFVVHRNPKLGFFGDYWALPGGVFEEGDRIESDWTDDRAHQSCGLRELFEETGVLPRGLAGLCSEDQRSDLRDALLAEESGDVWADLLRQFPEAVGELHPLGLLTTPPFAARRYRTHFHHLQLPPKEFPRIIPGELTVGEFWKPGQLLKRWRAGELLIVPPLLAFLDLYSCDAGLHAWRRALLDRTTRSEAGSIHRIRHVPGIDVLPLRTPTLPPATTTNTYVVGRKRLFIIDPATPYADEQQRLITFLDERIVQGCELAGILVTHHHHDHVGAVALIAERYDLEVYGMRETLERLPQVPLRPHELFDGDRIELGRSADGREGWHLQAIHTPGHDRGHLVFLDSRYNSLIAGDLISTLSTILIDPPEGHLATYLDSLRRVLALAPGVIHPAHGMATAQGEATLRRFLSHRAMREAALVRALESGLCQLEDLVARVYQEVPEDLYLIAQRSLAAGLEKLEEEARVVRRADAWHLVTPSA